ncbi:DUF2690 domain-containing protein [[Kitasatospora] papulosa]|uniref:DUF2690 domain-containing protein n=1 Tax=[Kitasatospora] papulosa TaxID=1464011 RepID=UPI00368890F8
MSEVMCVHGIRRWGPTAAALALLAGVFQGVTASPAAAESDCFRDTCSGKDPIAMGCDGDAEILQQATMPDESVSIRLLWSPMCQGVWAKVSRDIDTSPTSVYLTLWTARDPDGGVQAGDSPGVLGSGVAGAYTKMQNWKKTTAKACWNDVDTEFDPAPTKYTIQSPAKTNDWPVDASLMVQHGDCTDWM